MNVKSYQISAALRESAPSNVGKRKGGLLISSYLFCFLLISTHCVGCLFASPSSCSTPQPGYSLPIVEHGAGGIHLARPVFQGLDLKTYLMTLRCSCLHLWSWPHLFSTIESPLPGFVGSQEDSRMETCAHDLELVADDTCSPDVLGSHICDT